MSDLISRQDAIDAILKVGHEHVEENLIRLGLVTDYSDAIRSLPSETLQNLTKPNKTIAKLPAAEPTLRERALMLLLNWAVECGFGYDNFPEEYERYKDEIEDMSYFDGMIYIAEKEVESHEHSR